MLKKSLTIILFLISFQIFGVSKETQQINVTIGKGIYSSVSVTKYYNTVKSGDSCLLVHGMLHNGYVFENLVLWMLANYPNISSLYTMDMPGHGKSTLNSNVKKFGGLSLENYTNTVSGILTSLKTQDENLNCVGGHSLGTMVIQNLQNILLSDQLSSMHDNWGIEKAIFFSPVIPEGDGNGTSLTWAFAEGIVFEKGIISPLLLNVLPLLTFSDLSTYGPYLYANGKQFLDLFFEYNGEYRVPGIPTESDIELYYSEKEPELVSLELGGLDLDRKRPIIRQNIFNSYHGTRLISVLPDGDPFIEFTEVSALQEFLTGSTDGFYGFNDSNSSHDFIYNFASFSSEGQASFKSAIDDLFY